MSGSYVGCKLMKKLMKDVHIQEALQEEPKLFLLVGVLQLYEELHSFWILQVEGCRIFPSSYTYSTSQFAFDRQLNA